MAILIQSRLSRRIALAAFAVAVAAMIFIQGSAPVAAQPASPYYWQYNASDRLTLAESIDVNGDGIDEVLVTDANGQVTLIEADGRVLWTERQTQPVLVATTARLLSAAATNRQVVLVDAERIRAVSPTGTSLWTQTLPVVLMQDDAATEEQVGPAIAESLSLVARPTHVAPYDGDGDGLDDVLVLLESGDLIAYGADGRQLWRLVLQDGTTANVQPQMVVADFDGDGGSEVAATIFTPRRFSQLFFINDNAVVWRQSISRRVTTVAAAAFRPNRRMIAVGTNFGQLDLYDPSGERLWFRTLNRSITSMAFAQTPQEPTLLIGTDAGSVVAYTEAGQRAWTANMVGTADRPILSIIPVSGRTLAGDSAIAVTMAPRPGTTAPADIFLLSETGQLQTRLGQTDLPTVSDLIDINHDSYPELLLARFAGLQLLGLGVGASEYAQGWVYGFNSAPQSTLFVDLDSDGEEEVVVGTQDGRLHALDGNQVLRWLQAPGDEIVRLDSFRDTGSSRPRVVVVRSRSGAAALDEPGARSWLELRNADGELLWRAEVRDEITALGIERLPGPDSDTILIGTRSGDVLAFDVGGERLWSRRLSGLSDGIRHFAFVEGPGQRTDLLLVAGDREIYAVSIPTNAIVGLPFARFEADISRLSVIDEVSDSERAVRVVVFTTDGVVHGLNWRGIELPGDNWPYVLGVPVRVVAAVDGPVEPQVGESAAVFLIATQDESLLQFDVRANQPGVAWSVNGLGTGEALNWDDPDADGRPDSAVLGTREGGLRLFEQLTGGQPQPSLNLRLGSSVFATALVRRNGTQAPELYAVTDNGQVRLYREEVNRPPLLSAPVFDDEQGQYSTSVFVNDVDGDSVTVRMEALDAVTGAWISGGEEVVDTSGTVFWQGLPVEPQDALVTYRFFFDDGLYRGYLTPPAGVISSAAAATSDALPALITLFGVGAAALAVVLARQATSPQVRARRFYRQLEPEPDPRLKQIEQQYTALEGSPDFLMQLANAARHEADNFTTGMADGLFLLPNRPQAGLSIIVRTLDDGRPGAAAGGHLDLRRQLYATTQSMLEAPSITELSLLRPQFVHLLETMEMHDRTGSVLGLLLPVLTNLRDSERVDSVDDRLVYLNQASVHMRQLQEQLAESAPTVERTLTRMIARRWAGLVGAEIEEQRGRAELQVTLLTRRIVPNGDTHVTLEIRNSGRAAAENLVATLEQNPAYRVLGDSQSIPFLPPGRMRQVRFQVEPQVEDRFRISMLLRYDDRSRHDRSIAFGDMVNLLPPAREFRPIPNPYLPGTPLRRDSQLFFGREELFDFIAGNAAGGSQRNVLMLVGQRRTGKTSLLLRLEEYLAPELVPVYIDCQSLGITPGMPALLQELAWHITDALSARGMQVAVPPIEAWEQDPARVFQRTFLPAALAALPAGARLLLVFDEFEVFESMVGDGILPPTFFTYMRHLMQHSEGLSFIFVGARRLEEMSADYWSVLFNIALYRKIDYLSEQAAIRLICEPVAPNLVYDDLAIDKVLRVTAGHPYFLQLVCYTLVKRANQEQRPYVTISDVNDALDEMLRLGEVHFAYLWQRSSHAARALLTAAAHLSDHNEPLHPEQLAAYLESFNIVLDPADVTTALSSLVERDILREVTEEGKALYELRIGLVGQWVARNKSLSKLYALNES